MAKDIFPVSVQRIYKDSKNLCKRLSRCISEIDFGVFEDIEELVSICIKAKNLTTKEKIKFVQLSLKATNFSKKWSDALVLKNIHDKHGISPIINPIYKFHMINESELIGHVEKMESNNKFFILLKNCLLCSFGNFPDVSMCPILHVVEYIFSTKNSSNVLIECSKFAYELEEYLDLDFLFLKKIQLRTFYVNELKYLKDPKILEEILQNLRSHRVINCIFTKLLMIRKFYIEATNYYKINHIELLCKTYNPDEVEYTKEIFKKIQKLDYKNYERNLKDFIVTTGTTKLSELFFRTCVSIDSKYIDCYSKCDKEYILLSNIDEIYKSRYFNLLTIELETFKTVIQNIREPQLVISRFFEAAFSSEFMGKLLYLCVTFPSHKWLILSQLINLKSRIYDEFLSITSSKELDSYYLVVNELRDNPDTMILADISITYQPEYILNNSNLLDDLDWFSLYIINNIYLKYVTKDSIRSLLLTKILLLDDLYSSNYWATVMRKNLEVDMLGCNIYELFTIEGKYIRRLKLSSTQNLIELYQERELDVIADEIDLRNKYLEGLVTGINSVVEIEINSKNTSFYGMLRIVEGNCNQPILIMATLTNEKIEIYSEENQFKVVRFKKENSENLILENKLFRQNKIKIGIKFKNKFVKIDLNGSKIKLNGIIVSKISVGRFKGVINRILVYEGANYNEKYLDEMNHVQFYLQRLKKLEKQLIYSVYSGIFIYTTSPYILNMCAFRVKYLNILQNINVNWRRNALQ